MAKKIFYDDDARERVLEGAKALYEAVRVTMGPKGRNVVVSRPYGGPMVTHDGVTVAKSVEIEQRDDDTLGWSVGAELVKQAASKTNDSVGDGTTTATVLTYHILNEANKLIAAGHNPMDLRKGVDQAAEIVLDAISELTEEIAGDRDKLAEVATISAGDPEIGGMIADVVSEVGEDGVVTVEQSQELEVEKEVVEGFKMDRGYVSPYMVTDAARMEANLEKPQIIITDQRLSNIRDIAPFLDKVMVSGKSRSFVIIADDFQGDVLPSLVLNKMKGIFTAVAIKAPLFGDRRKQVLEDIAILTGATIISEDNDLTFEKATLEVLGSARRVISTATDTAIIEGDGDSEEVAERISAIKGQIEHVKSEYDKENLEKRLAALAGKVAVIKVGGATETEIEEKKFRVDDAVEATKAALAEGIVPGGGVTLVDLSRRLHVEPTSIGSSEEAGHLVLKRALVQPFRELMRNAGFNPDEKLPQAMGNGATGMGFDVNHPDDLVFLRDYGVVDPAKVTKEAIQNAVSIAGTAMTMGCLMVEIPEEKQVDQQQRMM